MAKKSADSKIGNYLFLVAIALAIIAGLIPGLQAQAWISWVMVLLGLIVGLLNITAKETTGFLVASIALLGVGNATILPIFGTGMISGMLDNILALVSPAALLVALKTVYECAKD